MGVTDTPTLKSALPLSLAVNRNLLGFSKLKRKQLLHRERDRSRRP